MEEIIFVRFKPDRGKGLIDFRLNYAFLLLLNPFSTIY